jgi:hypothetical protein
VPSSISSSDARARSGSRPLWPVAWFLAFGVVALCLFGWESYWRGREFDSYVVDDQALWALERQRASDLGGEAIVLVGTSRMQMGIHKESFAQATGWPPAVQLAVVRGPTVPILRHLAGDSSFRGTVIAEVNPVLFFAATPGLDREFSEYVETFEELRPIDEFERRLRKFFEMNFVTLQPGLAASRRWRTWRLGRPLLPGYGDEMTPDRYRYGNYLHYYGLSDANKIIGQLQAKARPRVFGPKDLSARIRDVKEMLATIRSRGGDVIFVRLPAAHHSLKFELSRFPRRQHWDVFADEIDAAAIHYSDYPGLSQVVPADGDHFDKAQAVIFSRALADVLVQLSLAPGSDD